MIAENREYWGLLKEKLLEETMEFIEDETLEELADILEVIDAICLFRGISKKELFDFQVKKKKERGSFSKRLILVQPSIK